MSEVQIIKNHETQPTNFNSLSPKQKQLIKRTVASDTTSDEFDMFIEICKRQGLDPFKRQIYALVFSKDDDKKRKVTFITGIDGYRAIANRSGNYRPSPEEPTITYDESKICPDTNPKGIVKAQVAVMQWAKDGWYPIMGSAQWDEFAPVRHQSKWDKEKKRYVPVEDGKKWLEKDTWKDMPEIMIAKCAEAQALRKGWPEEVGGLYVSEEMHRAQADMTASEEIAQYEEENRLKAVKGANHIPMIMSESDGLEMVAEGEFSDRVLELIRGFEESQPLEFWYDRNKIGFQQFWARHKGEALELKAQIEKRIQELKIPVAEEV